MVKRGHARAERQPSLESEATIEVSMLLTHASHTESMARATTSGERSGAEFVAAPSQEHSSSSLSFSSLLQRLARFSQGHASDSGMFMTVGPLLSAPGNGVCPVTGLLVQVSAPARYSVTQTDITERLLPAAIPSSQTVSLSLAGSRSSNNPLRLSVRLSHSPPAGTRAQEAQEDAGAPVQRGASRHSLSRQVSAVTESASERAGEDSEAASSSSEDDDTAAAAARQGEPSSTGLDLRVRGDCLNPWSSHACCVSAHRAGWLLLTNGAPLQAVTTWADKAAPFAALLFLLFVWLHVKRARPPMHTSPCPASALKERIFLAWCPSHAILQAHDCPCQKNLPCQKKPAA